MVSVSSASLKPLVVRAVESLPEPDRQVLRLRFGLVDGECHSHAEIGLRLGLSVAEVRHIEEAALFRLRQADQARKAQK
jgi:DNA-directed RNA polymerase sigma subunit (sigma70/sigma32)